MDGAKVKLTEAYMAAMWALSWFFSATASMAARSFLGSPAGGWCGVGERGRGSVLLRAGGGTEMDGI